MVLWRSASNDGPKVYLNLSYIDRLEWGKFKMGSIAILSFIHTSQFFPGKFIPAVFLLNPNYASLEANFPEVSSQNGKKTEIFAYFRFNLLLISIFLVLFLKKIKISQPIFLCWSPWKVG